LQKGFSPAFVKAEVSECAHAIGYYAKFLSTTLHADMDLCGKDAAQAGTR